MNCPSVSHADEDQVRQLLEHWARASQKGLQDEILVKALRGIVWVNFTNYGPVAAVAAYS